MTILREVFSQAAGDFRRTWRELLLTDAVYKVVAFAVLFPLVGVALRFFASTTGSAAIADTDILFFVLSPVGFLALVVVGALSLGIVVLEQACLMTIGLGATQNARVTAWEALWYGARHAGTVVRLAIRIVLRLLLVAAPFLAAGGLVYLTLLTEFDINYYLTETSPVVWAAAVIVIGLLIILAVVLIRLVLGWILALPLVLFEEVRPRDALKTSVERIRNNLRSILSIMVAWIVGTILFSSLALGAVRLLGQVVLPSLSGSVPLLVLATGGLVLLWIVVNIVVTLLSAAAFALLTVRLYERLGESDGAVGVGSAHSAPLEVPRRWRLSRRKILVGLSVLAVTAGLAGGLLLESVRVDDDVLILAHRGAAGVAPENTLAAFERAITDGADFVELDVQETADGEVVVIHDSDLMKVGGVNLKIWDATYEQLQDIDIGSRFSPDFSKERVPTLEQALALCKGKVRVDIELKYYGHDQRLEERVVEIVERTGMESQIVVMSLEYDAIRKVRKLRPNWTVGLLTAKAVGDLTRLDADFLAVHTGLVSPRFVRAAHRSGKEVFAWTVNDPVQMATMIGRGVDGLITDEPALARKVLEELSGMNPVERLMLELSLWLGVVPTQAGPEADAG